jgi:hypothetical protein
MSHYFILYWKYNFVLSAFQNIQQVTSPCQKHQACYKLFFWMLECQCETTISMGFEFWNLDVEFSWFM